jgi:hypothetical protein
MAFVVLAGPEVTGQVAFRAEKRTRRDAMATAVELLGQGIRNVTIIDETGQLFRAAEFVRTFGERD